MELIGPQSYKLNIVGNGYSVLSPDKKNHFIKPATSIIPKLYTISKNSALIYIGVTKQPMASRFRGGMNASGDHSYHGYSWRRKKDILRLDVWSLHGTNAEEANIELETIEAETVLLFRNEYGQWPVGQTEIHFHSSNNFHRNCARKIINSFSNINAR